ncbi:hypothetical protein ACFWIB_14630 [Streptomyces sp. NPDC127051]|uniref:hypothetical protein n=1 Tax=Streptomyces sp. NPDC127051 TaxID=3347119 RepID=UPI00365E10BC
MSTYTNELGTTQTSLARRVIAVGIKRGPGPLVVEQPQQAAADARNDLGALGTGQQHTHRS